MQKIISLWIAMTLLLAPVPALSFAQVIPDSDHCMTDQQHAGHTQPMSHHLQTDTGDSISGCTHCKYDRCEDGGCSDQNCTSFNSPTTFMVTFASRFIATPEVFSLTAYTGLLSRPVPPLLRPPV